MILVYSVSDEVRAKTRALEKMQIKYKTAEEEIKDLEAEFQEEKEDLLDTLRKQNKTIQLQSQLLDTIVPLLRRDCNYYNLDKIRAECQYDENHDNWILPKVMTSSTSLSPIGATSQGRVPKRNGPNGRPVSPLGLQSTTEAEDKFAAKWQSKGNSVSYFSPKRAQELLSECSSIKGTPPSTDRGTSKIKSNSSLDVMKSNSFHDQSNTFGINEPQQFIHSSDGVGKPRKLHAIPNLPGITLIIIIHKVIVYYDDDCSVNITSSSILWLVDHYHNYHYYFYNIKI